MWWETVEWIHLSMANNQWLYKHRPCEYVDWTYLVLLNVGLFFLLHALHKIHYNDKVCGLLQCLLFML